MKFNGANVSISPKAKLGRNVRIGNNTVIYDNVIIGDNTTICNNCVLGEPLNDYYRDESYENPVLEIGADSLVRSHTILYAGSRFGAHFSCGHRVTVREYVEAGDYCAIGTLCDIQGYTTFGNYCRLHSNVHIGQQSSLGNFVFIYPYVVFANDPHPPSTICKGPVIGDYTQIAIHAVVLPMVTVGKNCLIGANATVNKDFGDDLLIVGSPAKAVGLANTIRSKEKNGAAHYPWMFHFERGMPWEGIGYSEWEKNH